MSTLLYDEQHQRRDMFEFKINSGGNLNVVEVGTVQISFVDGKFERAAYPMTGTYSRNGWRILAAIEKCIIELETSGKLK